jgi:adenosine deaminase
VFFIQVFSCPKASASLMSASGGVVELKVGAHKGIGFYVRAPRKLIEQGIASSSSAGQDGQTSVKVAKPVDELRISGLGNATGIAIAVASSIAASGLGQIVRVETDYPAMPDGHGCASILIQVMRIARLSSHLLESDLDGTLRRVLLARAAPKVELHVHLDGSFYHKTMFEAAQKYRNQLPEKRICPWEDPVTNSNPIVFPRTELGDRRDLQDFKTMVTSKAEVGLYPLLAVFYRYLPVVMGRNDLLEEFAYRFCEFQKLNNVVYTEVRYSPHEFFEEEHKENPPEGMAKAVISSISKGLARGQQDFGISVKQILCCINFCPQWSMDTVKTALECRDLGVVGVDIASGEHHFDIDAIHQTHKAAMDFAYEKGMPITVHAGEAGGADNCVKAVDAYHARRIGHGYHLLDDPAAYKRLKACGIHLECCPTSSMLTKAVSGEDGWCKHPIRRYLDDGMSMSLSTDDPMVFDIDFRGEMDIAVTKMGFSLEDIRTCTTNAINAAFCDDKHKADIQKQVDAWFEDPCVCQVCEA